MQRLTGGIVLTVFALEFALSRPYSVLFPKRGGSDRKPCFENFVKMAVACKSQLFGNFFGGFLSKNYAVVGFLQSQLIYVLFKGHIEMFFNQP